jgi:putative SOS response-associated peptidase YedK
MTDVEKLSDLWKPYDDRLMQSYPVRNRVNQVQNDDADCAKPIDVTGSPQDHLFA